MDNVHSARRTTLAIPALTGRGWTVANSELGHEGDVAVEKIVIGKALARRP